MVCLYKDQKEEFLKMFSLDHQELAKYAHWNSEGKPLHAAKKVSQDIIYEQSFSWLESFNDFSISSNKRQSSEDRDSVNLEEPFLLTSKTTYF